MPAYRRRSLIFQLHTASCWALKCACELNENFFLYLFGCSESFWGSLSLSLSLVISCHSILVAKSQLSILFIYLRCVNWKYFTVLFGKNGHLQRRKFKIPTTPTLRKFEFGTCAHFYRKCLCYHGRSGGSSCLLCVLVVHARTPILVYFLWAKNMH